MLPYVTTWVVLENMRLRKIDQAEKDKNFLHR